LIRGCPVAASRIQIASRLRPSWAEMLMKRPSELNMGNPCPGSNRKGMPAAWNSRACCSMPSRPSGAMMPSRTFGTSVTWFMCEKFIAPG